MHNSRRFTVAATVLATLALLLSACGANPTPGSASGQQTGGQIAAAVNTKTPKDVLVIALDTDIDNLDPQAFRSPAAYTVAVNTSALPTDYAVKTREDGALVSDTEKMVSTLADVTLSADMKLITYKIKPGFKFTNGNPVNAAALKYTLERALKGPTYTKVVYGGITLTDAKQIEVVDDLTLRVQLEKGTRLTPKILPLAVNPIMDPATTQAHATADDPWATKWYKTNVMGTGPYLVDHWTPSVEMVLKPTPDWPGKVANKGVVLKFVPSAEERYALLKRGDVDVAIGIPYKDVATLKQDPNFKVWDFSSRIVSHLVMNATKGPFNNKLVRQAVGYAVPYKTLIDKVLYGFGQPARSHQSTQIPGIDPSYWTYDTNTAKAKDLLAQAGYPSGFKTQLYVSLSRSDDQAAAVWIQEALKGIGIETEIVKLSEAQYRAKWAARELPMFIDQWGGWVTDAAYNLYFLFHSKSPATNLSGFSTPALDSIIDQAYFELDPAKRDQLVKEAQRVLADEIPMVPLYERNEVYVSQKNVKGINYWADRYPRFALISKE